MDLCLVTMTSPLGICLPCHTYVPELGKSQQAGRIEVRPAAVAYGVPQLGSVKTWVADAVEEKGAFGW